MSVFSVMLCSKERFTVVTSRKNCSSELEVYSDNGERYYIDAHSRLVQKTKTFANCQSEKFELGNVFKVFISDGAAVYITQNRNITVFSGKVQNIQHSKIFISGERITLLNTSFSGSGLYGKEELEERNAFIYTGPTYDRLY